MSNDIYHESPEQQICTDKWPTMTISELQNQQSLLINRMAIISGLRNSSYNPEQYQQIFAMMENANAHLSELIAAPPRKQAPPAANT